MRPAKRERGERLYLEICPFAACAAAQVVVGFRSSRRVVVVACMGLSLLGGGGCGGGGGDTARHRVAAPGQTSSNQGLNDYTHTLLV
jgi:hypothetical protein